MTINQNLSGADKRKELRLDVNLTVCSCIKNPDGSVTITTGKLIDVNSKAVKMSLPFVPEINTEIYIYPKLQYDELLFKEMPLCVKFLRRKSNSSATPPELVEIVCMCLDDQINVREKVSRWMASYR